MLWDRSKNKHLVEVDDENDPREEKYGQEIGDCQIPNENVDGRTQKTIGRHKINHQAIAYEANDDDRNEETDFQCALPCWANNP